MDEERLAISEGWIWKSRLATEGANRFVYVEPSNENWDRQNEQVAQSALLESAPLFLERGNIDIAHLTILGRRLGIRHPELFEIGKPVKVKGSGTKDDPIVVKAIIYRGPGRAAEQAEIWWDSRTRQYPPQDWWPSVGGKVVERDCRSSPRGCILKALEWVNIGFAKHPVNDTVKAVALSMDELTFAKALVAGYGSDTALLTGGAALRRESLDGAVHHTLPTSAIDYLRGAHCAHTAGRKPSWQGLLEHLQECGGLAHDDAHSTATAILARLRQRKLAAANAAQREVS